MAGAAHGMAGIIGLLGDPLYRRPTWAILQGEFSFSFPPRRERLDGNR